MADRVAFSPLAILQGVWVDCLRSVLGQVAGFSITVEPLALEPPVAAQVSLNAPQVWGIYSLAKALRGELAVLTTEAVAVQFSQILMSETPEASVPFDPGRREAYDELLSQVIGQIATGLKNSAGGDVEIKPLGKYAPTWPSAGRTGMRISGEKLPPVDIFVVMSADLAASFPGPPAQVQAVPSATVGAPHVAVGQAPAHTAAPDAGADAGSSTLEFLLDVKLDATIRFGEKQVLLRDILALHPGVALALERRVEEPVELLVGGRMVARGEVVIVDRNYGLRITEILSRKQRLEFLGKE